MCYNGLERYICQKTITGFWCRDWSIVTCVTTKSPRLWSTGDLHSPRIGTPTCHYVINVSEGKTALCFIAVLQNGSMWYLNQKGCPLSEGYINIYYFNLLCTTKENKPGSLFLRSIWNIHNLLFGCFIRTESSSHVSLCENRELGNFKIFQIAESAVSQVCA